MSDSKNNENKKTEQKPKQFEIGSKLEGAIRFAVASFFIVGITAVGGAVGGVIGASVAFVISCFLMRQR